MPDVTGTEGDDTFTGSNTVGATYYGLGGDDWLRSGLAADVFDGGQGVDTIDYGRESAGVLVDLAAGVGARGDQLVSVENLIGSTFADTLGGTAGANVLAGGAGVDTVTYASAASAVTVSLLLQATAQDTGGAGVDTLTEFQNLTGSAFNDSLAGDKSANLLSGGEGNDYLSGDAGNDTLQGGNGEDCLSGGGGDNLLVGGAGNDAYALVSSSDVVQEDPGGGHDSVLIYWDSTPLTYTLSANVEDLTAYSGGLTHLYGNADDNAIKGGAGRNTLAGGDGADTLFGGVSNDELHSGSATGKDLGAEHDVLSAGAGNDSLFIGYGDDVDGGAGYDTLSISLAAAPSGVTLRVADFANSATLGGGVIQHIERVADVRGSNFGDTVNLATVTTPTTVEGFGGADTVYGSPYGAVDFTGGDGGDRLYSRNAGDSFDGGDGADTIYYSGAYLDLSTSTTVVNVENVIGGDTVGGTTGNNILSGGTVTYATAPSAVHVDVNLNGQAQDTGGAGVDTLTGFQGVIGSAFNDTLVGGAAEHSRVDGGDGNDMLTGSALNGGAGDDTLEGTTGGEAELLTGGTGNDVYINHRTFMGIVELSGEGYDTVYTSVSAVASPNVEAVVLTGSQPIDFDGGTTADATMIIGNSAADRIQGSGGHDTISGGAGADDFRYYSTPNAADSDLISDFEHGVDRMVFYSHFFPGLPEGVLPADRLAFGSTATGPNAQFIYDAGVRTLYWDADGTGAGAAIPIASFAVGATLMASDIFVTSGGQFIY